MGPELTTWCDLALHYGELHLDLVLQQNCFRLWGHTWVITQTLSCTLQGTQQGTINSVSIHPDWAGQRKLPKELYLT